MQFDVPHLRDWLVDLFIKHVRDLQTHGEWADGKLLFAAQSAMAPIPIVMRELAHVRGAQEIWLSRIENRASTLPVWPTLSVDELGRTGQAIDVGLRTFCEQLDAATLDRVVAYTNTAGQMFSTPLDQILLHLFTHGQYHRGKANVALRDAGVEPASVDYIQWQRET